uniref:SCP domain-containing protein n=1 Tax=Bursaphelenchus xylophilus TaxID=6326 RepID=A0A1I7RXH7_BURXY
MKVLYLSWLVSFFLHEYVAGDVLSIAAKKALLKTHNDHRRRLAKGEELNKENKNMPKAANMMKMFYNKNLEKKADEWLKKCQFARVPGVEGGQNLYMVSSAMEQGAFEADGR